MGHRIVNNHINVAYLSTQNALSPFSTVTGNFTASGFGARYLWSGTTVSWTGTLGTPSTLSGAQMSIVNVATGATLVLTGNVFYGVNYTVPSRSTVALWSEGSTWIPV